MRGKRKSNFGFIAALVIVAILAFSIGLFYIHTSSNTGNLALSNPIFHRTVFARVYQTYPSGSATYNWTAGNATPLSVGQAIGSMNASYVSALIRSDHNAIVLPSNVVNDYNTIRNTVDSIECPSHPTSCFVKFDIVIRTNQYANSSQISSDMTSLSTQIPFDIFWLDSAGGIPNSTLIGAIQTAHSLGKLIIGDWSGFNYPPKGFDALSGTIASVLPVTSRDLFASLSQVGSVVTLGNSSLNFMQKLNLPLLLHGNNFSPDRETFVQNFTQAQRIQWITESAQLQRSNGFAFMYSIFGPYQAPIGTAYNSVNDGTLSLQVSLINQYNR